VRASDEGVFEGSGDVSLPRLRSRMTAAVTARIAMSTPPRTPYPSIAGSPRNVGELVLFAGVEPSRSNPIGTETLPPWTCTIPEVRFEE